MILRTSIAKRFLLGAFLTSLLLTTREAGAERPNILFVLTDDQAPWAFGASGNPQAFTPHMDRLVKEGAYLENCFVVTPVCSPSRASLMSSRYGSELGITDWIHPKREPELGLDPKIVTWPEVLQKSGYRTGLVGKWHLGVPDRFHPTKTGFDEFMGFRTGGTTPVNPTFEFDGKPKKFEGLTVDIITDHALLFIEKHRAERFLLCVHYRAPHTRWLPVADEDMAPYKDLDMKLPHPDYPKLDVKRAKRFMREYLASVRGVDRNLGRLLASLDEHELTKNTVVVFSSDHGYNMGHNGIWHKGNGHWITKPFPAATKNIPRGQRPNMYDHSLRVPTAVRWPGKVKPGSVVANTISFLDWFPTLAAIGGAELPKGQTIRGRDFVPLLDATRTGQVPKWDDDFYAEYSTHHQSRTHMRMYRTTRWKLVRDFLNDGRDELYDLRKDPGETKNLIADPAPEVKRVREALHAKMIARMKENGDKVLESIGK